MHGCSTRLSNGLVSSITWSLQDFGTSCWNSLYSWQLAYCILIPTIPWLNHGFSIEVSSRLLLNRTHCDWWNRCRKKGWELNSRAAMDHIWSLPAQRWFDLFVAVEFPKYDVQWRSLEILADFDWIRFLLIVCIHLPSFSHQLPCSKESATSRFAMFGVGFCENSLVVFEKLIALWKTMDIAIVSASTT